MGLRAWALHVSTSMKTARNLFSLGVIGAGILLGCSTEGSGEDADAVENAATPANVDDVFEQVKICDNLFKDRAAFRDVDLAQGVLRWKCGDVDKVTISGCEDDLDKIAARERQTNVDADRASKLSECGDGYGQEYCEYNALAQGNVVNTVTAAKSLKDADAVECVFTSVHSDARGANSSEYHKSLASSLASQVSAPERDLEGRVAGMKQGVNSRSAADTLIKDCSELGASTNAALHRNAERQVRCYHAWSTARSEADKKKIARNCADVDLGDDAAFARTGLDESSALSDADKDLAACTMVLKAKHGGVSWRNSDPSICARAYRATHDCNVDFKKIGEVAPDFPGFSMMGWTNRDILPPGCKYANIDGASFKHVVVCTPNPQDVKAYRTQKKPLQQLCRDKFGLNVAMQAPMGALANLSQAKTDGEFCSAFVAGAKKAQGQ